MSTLHLRSAPSVLLSLLGLLSSVSAADPAIGRYATMDHGPCYAGTIVQPDHVCSNKGLVITLDPQRQALAVFDTELLRFSYGALHASLHFPSGRDGLEGQPNVDGDVVFAASTSTGWARPGSGDFADPRDLQKSDQHLGALPISWGRYEGLFLHQDLVVLSYRVGAAQILEAPGLETEGRISAIARNLTLSGNTQALTLLVGEREGTRVGVVDGLGLIEDDAGILAAGVVGNGTFACDGSRLVLTIPGGTPAVKLLVWRGVRDDLPAFKALLNASHVPVDAHALITGGPGRWGPALTTVGELGHEDGPYVVDTIAVPYDNPSRSYMRLSGHDFFADGRAAVCTIDGDVWIVSGIDAGLAHLSWRRFATGLFQPLGLRIVDGKIYVLCRDRIVRLRDIDGDGEADWYESFNADCPVTRYYHEFAMDLVTDREGNFYYNKGSNLGEAVNDAQGCVLKVSRDGSTLTTYCTGMREANGMGGGDGYPLLNSDNQGNWMPVCRINQLKEGGFYGFMGAAHRDPKPATYDPPLIWTHYPLDNSTGGLTYVDHPGWGPFQDKPIGVSYGKSSMFILLPEEVDGVPQAGAIYLPLGFASGAMRTRFSPVDGQLYVTGLRGWQTNGAREGAFQRVRFTGKQVHTPTSLHVRSTALVVGFDQQLDAATAENTDNYAIERWNYRYTSAYGSKDYRVSDPTKEGHDTVDVSKATLSSDRKTVTLQIPGLAPVMQMRTKYKITAADGSTIAGEWYQTINRVPKP